MAPNNDSKDEELRYTVFIRVPFPRGQFEDPPAPNWNASKDRELWKILSSTSKGAEIDWNGLAAKFDVTLPFLLQEAAWLYERQLSQVREQLRRVGKPSSSSGPASPSILGSATTGGASMKRAGSGGSYVPSALSLRPRGSFELRHDSSNPSTPVQATTLGQARVPYSRTESTNTITQLAKPSSSSFTQRLQRRSVDSDLKHTRVLVQDSTPLRAPSSRDSSPASSSSSDGPVARSRVFSSRPRFSSNKAKGKAPLHLLSSADEDDDEEEEDSPAFLPFSNVGQGKTALPQENTRKEQAANINVKGKQKANQLSSRVADPAKKEPSPSSSASLSSAPQNPASSSSVPSLPSPVANAALSSPSTAGPRTALAALSPKQRRIAARGDGSEGTPSMGSSFSDLDDASITQSALEEALAREIKAGKGSLGVVGRVGGLFRAQSSKQAAIGQGQGHGQGQGQPSKASGRGGGI